MGYCVTGNCPAGWIDVECAKF